MADHAIVLYDPTIDYKPTPSPASLLAAAAAQGDRELSPEELVKLEAEEKLKKQKDQGVHKSLKAILGLDKVVRKEDVKVPVVIDPRLCKTLRPHQVEGVKVSVVSSIDGEGSARMK